MGGLDKAALQVGGVALLDRVLAAARPVCDRLLVVGPTRPTAVPGVEFVMEDRPGGGPVPAVLAGLDACPGCDTLLVLATDLPLLLPDHLRLLLAELDRRSDVEAVAAVGPQGANPLLAAYRSATLASRAARLGLGPGAAASRLLPDAVWTVDLGPGALNVNRPEDLAAAELLLADEG
jgi:molybdopterin-guanine dinucleotide biosynthesis protein A